MEPPEPEPFRKHAAYHEAGHVIADLVFGYRFRFVTIRPAGPEGDDGAVYGFRRGRAKDLAVVELAGIAASAKLAGRDPWTGTDRPEDDLADLDAADRFIDNWVVFLTRTYGEAPYREKIVGEARETTRLLVARHWNAITAVAEMLLAKGTLTYDDVVRLLKDRCPAFVAGKKE